MKDTYVFLFMKAMIFLLVLTYISQAAALALDLRLTSAKEALPQEFVTQRISRTVSVIDFLFWRAILASR